jgi:hypothetical protein
VRRVRIDAGTPEGLPGVFVTFKAIDKFPDSMSKHFGDRSAVTIDDVGQRSKGDNVGFARRDL